MNPNAYRTRAERGEVQLGTWVTMIRTPAVLTLLRSAGLDFVRVDMEHSSFSMETVADMAILARALDFPMVVRPPEGNREWITRLLDAGVWNLHVPQVDTPEQAAAVASCCRYAPLGERGMYGFGPHTEYRTLPPAEHMAAANARVHVTIMLETKEAFERLDEIASVPGIDALTLGPTDLAQNLGVLGTPKQKPVLDEYRRRLVEAADDCPRRHDHQLLLRYGGPPLRLCLGGRGDSPDVTLVSAALSFGVSWLVVYPLGPSVKTAGVTSFLPSPSSSWRSAPGG
jgi:2-keto-3-deoxy-L-rhamnonate aldolase RhmA